MPAKMKIRSAYATLPSAERKVADFILENSERATRMVINEIAEAAGVSVPSVTRLARKLGYSGFLDFRVALASGTSSMELRKNTTILPEDSDETVIEKTYRRREESESFYLSLEENRVIVREGEEGTVYLRTDLDARDLPPALRAMLVRGMTVEGEKELEKFLVSYSG